MFILAVVNPHHNHLLIPLLLAAVSLYFIYLGVKGLLKDDLEDDKENQQNIQR